MAGAVSSKVTPMPMLPASLPPSPRTLTASILRSLQEVIDDLEQLESAIPVESRARVRALALLWAAHDEIRSARELNAGIEPAIVPVRAAAAR